LKQYSKVEIKFKGAGVFISCKICTFCPIAEDSVNIVIFWQYVVARTAIFGKVFGNLTGIAHEGKRSCES